MGNWTSIDLNAIILVVSCQQQNLKLSGNRLNLCLDSRSQEKPHLVDLVFSLHTNNGYLIANKLGHYYTK